MAYNPYDWMKNSAMAYALWNTKCHPSLSGRSGIVVFKGECLCVSDERVYWSHASSISFLLGKHGVPGGQADGLLLEQIHDLGGDILLVYHEAEHILVEPLVGDDEVATIAV